MPEAQAGAAAGPAPVRLWSGDHFGLEGRPVEVQVDVSSRGSPGFSIVGLPGKSTRESRERIRAAIRNAGFRFPSGDRVLVNLAPASQEKEGAAFDLPMALGVLLATGQPGGSRALEERGGTAAPLSRIGFLGELGLWGELRPVPGALLVASALRERGVRALVVPQDNADEAALLPDLQVFAARDIHQALLAIQGRLPRHAGAARPAPEAAHAAGDFAEVRGQEGTKRAFLVAAAGSHNVLVCGPPGVGKTMLAQRFPALLPALSFEESIEVTRVRSATGLKVQGLEAHRPFRAPHHTISYSGLVGGGSPPRPGEVSLAHRGVLFLDEIPEFPRRALEALRQPLEEGRVSISRSTGSTVFPARFLLVAAMNPCPCGYLGHPRRACRCTPLQVEGYRQRISGPLLDRIDLRLAVGPVESQDLLHPAGRVGGLGTAGMRETAAAARARQARRWGPGGTNGQAPLRRLLVEGQVSAGALRRLERAAERDALSVRSFERMLRVARTAADLEGSGPVEERHVDEAMSYR